MQCSWSNGIRGKPTKPSGFMLQTGNVGKNRLNVWFKVEVREKVLKDLVEELVMWHNGGEEFTLLDVCSVIEERKDAHTTISGDGPPDESWKLRLQDRPAAISG